jgi:hypothetical protein
MIRFTEFMDFVLSEILSTRKHNVAETECFHPQVRGEIPAQLCPLEKATLNQ